MSGTGAVEQPLTGFRLEVHAIAAYISGHMSPAFLVNPVEVAPLVSATTIL